MRVSLSRQSRSHSDVVATHLNDDQGNAVIFKGDKYDPGLLPVDRQTSGRRFVARPDFSASCVLPDCASLSSPAYADDGLTYNASSTCVASDGTPPACDSAAPSARHRMCRCTTPRDSPPPPPPPPPSPPPTYEALRFVDLAVNHSASTSRTRLYTHYDPTTGVFKRNGNAYSGGCSSTAKYYINYSKEKTYG